MCTETSAYQSLRLFIQNRVAVSEEEWDIIRSYFSYHESQANEHLLEEGKVCRQLYYLHRGMMRFYVWKDGLDRTKFFAYPDYFFTSQASFHPQRPATENIQCLENSQYLALSYEDREWMRANLAVWNTFATILKLEVQEATEKLLMGFQNANATERYLFLLEEDPILLERVPLKYLASYIGVTPESLSRIRKNILPHRRT
ncbi:MAG: cyclic nucleotide-binding domain-containing protein [Bacteroidota bacterium]